MRSNEQYRAYYAENKERIYGYQRKYLLKKRYGLTPEQFLALLKTQDRKCAICGSSNPQSKQHGTFIVDHSHETGKIRGLLCSPCNRALGLMKDRADVLEKAAQYVREK